MKKLFFALMAVVAMTLASCSGRTEAPGAAEATAEAPAQADEVAAALESDINSGNADTFKARITAIIEKIKELVTQNPAVAQEYFTKAQEFLKTNADKITSLVGDNAEIKALVSTLADGNAASFVNSLMGNMGDAVQGLQDAVSNALEGVDAQGIQDAVSNAIDGVLNQGDAAGTPDPETPAAQ